MTLSIRRLAILVSVVPIVAGALTLPARAEVSAETDSDGVYVRTVVRATSSAKNVRVWSPLKFRPNSYPLNPTGDLNGDLWPAIEESQTSARVPWVVWSRFNGRGFDLAWARWIHDAVAWSPVGWVQGQSTIGDDLDPDLAFDGGGRPFLTWWRDDAGTGRVYLSLFLATVWMEPFEVSDAGVDSVVPTVTLLPDGRIQVEYDTAEGRVTRIIVFRRPDTITDDITPFGRMQVTESYTTPSLGR